MPKFPVHEGLLSESSLTLLQHFRSDGNNVRLKSVFFYTQYKSGSISQSHVYHFQQTVFRLCVHRVLNTFVVSSTKKTWTKVFTSSL